MASVFQSLFGGGTQAPNYGQGIAAIQGATNQAAGYLNQPQYNMIGSSYDTGLLSILSNYGSNGLNSMLQPSYNYGMQQIGQQTSQNAASAMSAAQGNGLGNSSIAAQGVNAAQQGGQSAQASLLAALLGQQYGSQVSAASQLGGQGTTMAGLTAQQQEALASLYQNEGSQIAGMYNSQANANTAAENQNNSMWGNFIGTEAEIGGGLLGAYQLGLL